MAPTPRCFCFVDKLPTKGEKRWKGGGGGKGRVRDRSPGGALCSCSQHPHSLPPASSSTPLSQEELLPPKPQPGQAESGSQSSLSPPPLWPPQPLSKLTVCSSSLSWSPSLLPSGQSQAPVPETALRAPVLEVQLPPLAPQSKEAPAWRGRYDGGRRERETHEPSAPPMTWQQEVRTPTPLLRPPPPWQPQTMTRWPLLREQRWRVELFGVCW